MVVYSLPESNLEWIPQIAFLISVTKLFILKSCKCFLSLAQFPVLKLCLWLSPIFLMASDKTEFQIACHCQIFFSLLSWVGNSSWDLEPSSKQGSNLPYPIGTRIPTASQFLVLDSRKPSVWVPPSPVPPSPLPHCFSASCVGASRRNLSCT